MTTGPCPRCIEKWGQEPSAWGDSVLELDSYREHLEQHMTDDYPRTPDFFRAVSATLLAGDIQAKVVTNPEHCFVEVSLVDGTRVFWSNSKEFWGYTVISETGDAQGDYETLPWDVDVEDAARMIAMHDYPAPAAYPGAPE